MAEIRSDSNRRYQIDQSVFCIPSVVHRMWYNAHLVSSCIGRVSYLIYVSVRHYVLTTSGDIVVFPYGSVFELLIC